MYVAVMSKLANILGVNLQLLTTHGMTRLDISTTGFASSRAARSERIEELVLACRWVCSEIGRRPGVLLLQVVPLLESAGPSAWDNIPTCILVFCAPK